MKKILLFALLITMSLYMAGCITTQKNDDDLLFVGMGHTFRDLRQHTFSDNKAKAFSEPNISSDGEKLAVVLIQDGNADIYVKKINAKAMTQKTFHRTDDANPAFSPDGSKLAFSSKRNGNWDIFVMNANKGKAKRQITFSGDHELGPSWSRDGTKVAYSRFSRINGTWEIWTYNLTNGASTNLVPGRNPKYSPTSDTLVFQRPNAASKDGWYALWTIDDEGNEETLIYSSEEEGFINPSWSPDGQRIVFATGGKEHKAKEVKKKGKKKDTTIEVTIGRKANDIWTINVDGTNLTQLTSHEAQDWAPAWSKNNRIFFSSTRDEFSNVWSVIPEFISLGEEMLDEDIDNKDNILIKDVKE